MTVHEMNRLRDALSQGHFSHGVPREPAKSSVFPFRKNNFEEMPHIFEQHNSCTDRCDMLVGPCACGATHSAEEWVLVRVRP